MPVPKKRTSRMKRNSRRAHDQLKLSVAQVCNNCGAFVLPHRVCQKCGIYKNEKVLTVN